MKKISVLIVDDYIDNRLLIGQIAEILGYDYTYANNGALALDALNAKNYDIILMDIEMPVLNGIETTRKIRNLHNRDKSRTPIIAITAHFVEDFANKYYDVGFNDFLTKPYTMEKLEELIIKTLS